MIRTHDERGHASTDKAIIFAWSPDFAVHKPERVAFLLKYYVMIVPIRNLTGVGVACVKKSSAPSSNAHFGQQESSGKTTDWQ